MGRNAEPARRFGVPGVRAAERSEASSAAPTSRPALDIYLPAAPDSLLFRLDALLDDYEPFAIRDGGKTGDGGLAGTGAAPRSDSLERRVYFFSAKARDAARMAVDRVLGPAGARTTSIDVNDDGWAARSQSRLRAIRVGDLIVTPPWDAPASTDGGRTVVTIEPSMGFGTGHHASTRLCLMALQRIRDRLRASRRVLDLGTGSGVLAMVAALLGARKVVAVERDPDALGNARNNVRRNRLADRVELVAGDLADAPPQPGDIVTANLTGAFFIRHAAVVLRCIRPGGLLLASGITVDEEPAARAALVPPLVLRERRVEEEWVGLVFERPACDVPPPPRTR